MPLRDLEGIPGAKSLIVCLTGYQRQDRDDIMVCPTIHHIRFYNYKGPFFVEKTVNKRVAS